MKRGNLSVQNQNLLENYLKTGKGGTYIVLKKVFGP